MSLVDVSMVCKLRSALCADRGLTAAVGAPAKRAHAGPADAVRRERGELWQIVFRLLTFSFSCIPPKYQILQ